MSRIRGTAIRGARVLAAALAAAAAGVASAEATGPSFSSDRPNIWGVWIGVGGSGGGDPRFRNTPWAPAPDFTPAGAEESRRAASPITPGECNPWGPIGYMVATGLFPFEIVPSTTGLVILFEPTVVPRRIYTDGRGHPPELDPTWLGHSVAHWEGDTLVVDTVGSNGRARPINGYVSGAVTSGVDVAPRLPVSDQLRLTERIRLVGDGEYLEDELTVSDPKYYKQPFTAKRYWRRRPDLEVIEYVCADNARPEAEGQAD